MLPCTYTIGRLRLLAAAGVETPGREAMIYGMSRPSVVFPIDPTARGSRNRLSESMKLRTSSYREVSRYDVASGRVRGGDGARPLRVLLAAHDRTNGTINSATAGHLGLM